MVYGMCKMEHGLDGLDTDYIQYSTSGKIRVQSVQSVFHLIPNQFFGFSGAGALAW